MSAKMLLSEPETLQAQEEGKSTEQDDQTVVESQAALNSTHCEPRDQVLNTTEILEGILECLPAKTLFVVQRVDKRFHHTIADSPRIQRKMFLRIDNDHSTVWYANHVGEGKCCLQQAPDKFRPEYSFETPEHMVRTPVVLNPCLERVRRPHNAALKAFFAGGEAVTFSCRQSFAFEQFGRQSIGTGFFSDPHCKTIYVRLSFEIGSTGFISVRTTIRSQTPLTIEEVVLRSMDTEGKVSVLWRQGTPNLSCPLLESVLLQHILRLLVEVLVAAFTFYQ